MAYLKIDSNNELYYEHVTPGSTNGCTYVFINALTGDTATWEAMIGPRIRKAGHGTLSYNLRGQANSAFSSDLVLDTDLVVADLGRLLGEVDPVRPVLVGLSIGGLFAARALQEGACAAGMVLINTLRREGPRLRWIGDALVRSVEVGGLELFRDLFLELLVNEEWQSANRADFLKPGTTYQPLDKESGPYKLLSEAGRTADWDFPYESLDLPVLVITGLQDHVFLERDVVDDLFSRLPRGDRIDLPDAGHLIPAEQPEVLADLLVDFAKKMA